MSSYIRKIIVLFIFIYALFIPSTLMHAFADGKLTTGNIYTKITDSKNNIDISVNKSSKKRINENTNDTPESDTPNLIARNIQTVGNILSSSPSDLAEQAKSYALGKFNSTISSETQKWLSQFGTARINFGLDKKGTLENNSLDLLLPLYDNKADWLFFSQLGYRNKDSRNTINVGLGGRYFYQNWMYGLNTFYDHDLTGKNQRLGLGGEIWGDYIKLSANTYYRLSGLQESRNFKGFHERPANGYDINGEFFLPAYPNLGAKLTYEQYFGDNVTLFNRDTRQKNPSLAKLGLTYTPIPLVTMGVDYKQGESGHTETQFLANFNYKLGVPLSTQLSPENVASMRTLAGSRYDLVERNNNIVLDHKEIPKTQLSLPETIIGYSHQQRDISAQISSNSPIKQIHWAANEDFNKNGGTLSSKTGQSIQITLPKFLSGDNKNNNYTIYAFAEFNNGQKSEPVEMSVIVRPYKIKKREESNFAPPGPLPADGTTYYTFNPVITFDTVDGTPVKNATIDNVQWISDPAEDDASGLKFSWNKVDKLTTDELGNLTNIVKLTSKKAIQNAKIYLKIEGEPQQLVGTVSFGEDTSRFHVDKIKVSSPNNMTAPLIADGIQAYTYKAVVLDGSNNPVPPNTSIANINWDHDHKEISTLKLVPNGDKTDDKGQLTATLTSSEPVDDVIVTLSIEGQKKPTPADKVSFKTAKITLTTTPNSPILVGETYTVTAIINDKNSLKNLPITWDFDAPHRDKVTTNYTAGNPVATFSSSVEQIVTVKAAISGSPPSQTDLAFNWPSIQSVTLSPGTPNGTITSGGSYEFTATVFGADVQNKDTDTGNIPFEWIIKSPTNPKDAGLSLSPSGKITTVTNGKLNAELTSTKDKPIVTNAEICLTVVGAPVSSTTQKCVDSINFKSPPVDFEITSVEVHTVVVDGIEKPFDKEKPLLGNGTDKYKYRALITRKGSNGQDKVQNHIFSSVTWTRNQTQIDSRYLSEPEKTSLKTDDEGYLYATLDSHVGVGNKEDIENTFIKVTLTIPSELPGGAPKDKESDNLVSFAPVPQDAMLYVYNQYNPSVSQSFYKPHHPYNFFDALRGELRDPSHPDTAFNPSELQYEVDVYEPNPYPYFYFIYAGSDNKGPLSFDNKGSGTVKATITKKDGRIYLYEYAATLGRFLLHDANSPIFEGYHTINDKVTCDNDIGIGGVTYKPLSKKDFLSKYGLTAVGSEFKNLYRWGLFQGDKKAVPDKVMIKVLGDPNSPTQYVIYDSVNDKIVDDPNAAGLIVCTAG
ncbi:inverse autotransporter beta domain-containing protein [Xenorhabdus anantnagensis]|uniref:Inverse autotransporter beta domain-containing protein n=1 Tax=Xenorhabdus anantnagensis TaxID=3025875 RepID=A0ABT5LT29_9GAMM|nr:inverse autotransporter beta domain-containing protein [Xenorhabdus anantnagensis]MDC9597586.1 inverse autotransporter beta domain-containing protein [Xenorhabdus anantnagensis]